MLLVGAALLIHHFDLNVLALALPQVQRDLGVPEDQVAALVGVSRLGVLAAFLLAFLADRVGRRAVLVWTIVGTTVTTLLTGFAETPLQFFGLQTLARAFGHAEEILCFVVITEEVAANRRGLAMGRLSALGAVGTGLAAALYGVFGDDPEGWRRLYLIGGCGLILLVFARRGMKETARFETERAARAEDRTRAGLLAPFVGLIRENPHRMIAIGGATVPYIFGMTAAIALVSKRFQEGLGFAPYQLSILFIVGGTISYFAYAGAGRVADRMGRKRMLYLAMPGSALLYATIYLTPYMYVAIGAWIIGLFLMFASEMSLAMLGSELFPTSQRGTASAARVVLAVVAGAAGLGCESLLYGWLGSHAAAVTVLLCCAPMALVAVWFLPETAARELEEIGIAAPREDGHVAATAV